MLEIICLSMTASPSGCIGLAARGGAGRLGPPGGQKGLAALAAGHQGPHGQLPRVLPGPRRRGLPAPLLVVSDGAPGMIRRPRMPPAQRASALPGAQGTQPAEQGAGRSLTGVHGRPSAAIMRPRRRWRGYRTRILSRPVPKICPRRSLACTKILKPVSPICAFRWVIIGRSASLTWSNGYSAKNGGAPNSSRTRSASARSSR